MRKFGLGVLAVLALLLSAVGISLYHDFHNPEWLAMHNARLAAEAAEVKKAEEEATLKRAKWTKLRPDLDPHEYWARRCQPYVDRAYSMRRSNPNGLDTGFAALAMIACQKYERYEGEGTASMRELFEKCGNNECDRLPAPLSLSQDAKQYFPQTLAIAKPLAAQ
jgi:hypothetical protein